MSQNNDRSNELHLNSFTFKLLKLQWSYPLAVGLNNCEQAIRPNVLFQVDQLLHPA